MDKRRIFVYNSSMLKLKNRHDALAKSNRVWEVDFLRGLMMLCVIWDHTFNDIYIAAGGNYKTAFFQTLYDFSCKYFTGVVRDACQPIVVIVFIFTAGLSCSFSKNNFNRSLKLMAVSLFLTFGGFALSIILKRHMLVCFNVIHCIALSVFLLSVFDWFWNKCDKNWKKNVFYLFAAATVVVATVVGYCANMRPWTSENTHWFFLVRHTGKKYLQFIFMDARTFFPDFAWFLLGAFLGRGLYKEKKTLFPAVNPKYVSPLTYIGRHTLIIYFVSKILTYAFVYLFHGILDVL